MNLLQSGRTLKEGTASDSKKLGYRWPMLGLFSSIHGAANGFALMCIPPLFPLLRDMLGLTYAQLGTIWSMTGLSMLIFSPIAGSLGDSYGVRKVIAFGLGAGAIAAALRGIILSFWGLIITFFFFGFTLSFLIPNVHKGIGEWFTADQLGLGNGAAMGCAMIGSVLATLFATRITSMLGIRNFMFLTGFIVALIFVLWLIFAREVPHKDLKSGDGNDLRKIFGNILKALRERHTFIIGWSEFFGFGMSSALIGVFPTILVDFAGYTPETAIAIQALLFVGLVISLFLIPTVSDRLGNRCGLLISTPFVSGVIMLLLGWAVATSVAVPVIMVIAFSALLIGGGRVPLGRTTCLQTKEVDGEVGGSAIGSIFMLNRAGFFVFPVIVGFLIDIMQAGWIVPVLFGIFLFFIAAIAFLIKPERLAEV